MLEHARQVLKDYLDPKEKILVGLSGGADSVALAHLLYSEGYKLLFVHINFHLRGEESDRDERFVRQLVAEEFPCSSLIVQHFDTTNYAAQAGISIEMGARELRYQFFREVAHKEDCNWIAVGHHADDQVETGLLNLTRGTGGAGLAGMSLANQQILRPLLGHWSSEIKAYLKQNGLRYVTDSTNQETEYKRNYVRHKLIPMLEELNPAFKQVMLSNMAHFQEEQQALELLTQYFETQFLDQKTQSLTLPESTESDYFFKRLMLRKGFSYSQAEDMLRDWCSEKTTSFLGQQCLAQIYREHLFLIPNDLVVLPHIELSKCTEFGSIGTIELNEKQGELALHPMFKNKRLILRQAQREDVFQPFGMTKGSKKLFRYLGEKGVPEAYRPYCPVLECEGEVIAVIPLQIAHSARYEEKPLFISFKATDHPLSQLLLEIASLK